MFSWYKYARKAYIRKADRLLAILLLMPELMLILPRKVEVGHGKKESNKSLVLH